MKIANIDREFFYIFFRKDVFKDNIESHKKPEFHPLFRRYIFRKSFYG